MKVLKNYYAIKFCDEEPKKARWFVCDDELEIGDKVECTSKSGKVHCYGFVCGVFKATRSTMKQIAEQCGGYFPLAKCEKAKDEEPNDIFVVMRVCKQGNSPIDILDKIIEEIKEGGIENAKR